jgi:proteasome assembly chaperone (PAC2) family protein
MRLGAFEVTEPVPELNEPHAIAVIPWINAGKAASLVLSSFEKHSGGHKLARLFRPGEFFDFTRYRPSISRKEKSAGFEITNAEITWGRSETPRDFIFLRLPEPHAMAETYVDSVVDLLKYFKVTRYGLLGSVFDMVPYTRALMVSGSASNEVLQDSLKASGVVTSDYEGPTTILHLIDQRAVREGIETFSLFVHLPGYLTPEEDFRGQNRLLEVLRSFYDLPVSEEDLGKARDQEEQFKASAERFLEQQPQLKVMLKQLEDNYDARVTKEKDKISLSPEIEKFLKEMDQRFGQG